MKRLSLLLALLILALVSTGFVFAQEKAGKAAEAVKSEAAKKEVSPAPQEYRFGGIITAIDASAKRITIEQRQVKRERTVTLAVGKKAVQELPKLKIGEAVNVWVKGGTITRLEEVG
jgi:Cu/Ag efflux protein CusF